MDSMGKNPLIETLPITHNKGMETIWLIPMFCPWDVSAWKTVSQADIAKPRQQCVFYSIDDTTLVFYA